MNRLYDARVDEKRWKIDLTDNEYYKSYKLIDKEKEEIYFLNHIIGLEQVAEDEFLVYKRANYDDFELARYKLQNSKFYQLYSKKFSQFHFISDDRILFTYRVNNGPYRCNGIYSIKENKILEESKWLNGVLIGIFESDSSQNEIKLYVEEELPSYKLHNPKLLFTVDPNTLQPNSDCYSQLSNSYIKASSKEDIEIIRVEEQKNLKIIEQQMYQKEREQLEKAKTKILKIKTKTK